MQKPIVRTFFRDLSKEINTRLKEADKKARDVVIEQMIQDTDEFVPYKTGELSQSVEKLPLANGFLYDTEYASYAFDPIAPSGVKKKYTKDVHPKAQGYPFKAASNEHFNDWVDLYEREVLKNL